MKKFIRRLGLIIVFLMVLVIWTYHIGVYLKPSVNEKETGVPGVWLDRKDMGINHMILQGSPYWRGLESGRLTSHLLLKQEDTLVPQLLKWIPSKVALQGMILGSILWFQGIEEYFEPWMIQEMYGVSKSAPKKYDFMADGFTRQIAYHGLHEVGQLVVDQGFEAMGCTVVAAPLKNNWILGRNFDFEGGRIFDTEKIIKWVFPDQGYAYVSIIWAGMVGAVTGVNAQGIYMSINAAGSEDFKRVGMPSTLLLLKVLQNAKNITEALDIIEKEQMFITDILVLLDGKSGELYRIEKSPKRIAIQKLSEPSIVVNHLLDNTWKNDKTNNFRRDELTSSFRGRRGEELLKKLSAKNISNPLTLEEEVLAIIRDKSAAGDKPLHLGNRRAIDALIATHAVIYNGSDHTLYVSQGPAVAGNLIGYDLKKSFALRSPVKSRILKHDTSVSDEDFFKIKESNLEISLAKNEVGKKNCIGAMELLKKASVLFQEQSNYYEALGDAYKCLGEKENAKVAWQKSLDLQPAYPKTVKKLEELLKND